jgi:GntR family transcriptional regulator, transcriptional regulator of bglA
MGTKYKEVYAAIEKDIVAGRYEATRRLNTEDAYIEEYDVSRNTVRNAIDLLIKRGYCFPIQGSGVFLRRKKQALSFDLESIDGLTRKMAPLPVTNDVLEFKEISADEEMADNMDICLGSPLYYVERVRYVDGKPYFYEYAYLNKKLMVGFDKDTASGSIFDFLNNDATLKVAFVDLVIQAVKINQNEAAKFRLNQDDPGLMMLGFTMIRTGEVVQFCRTICHYENVRFLKLANYF